MKTHNIPLEQFIPTGKVTSKLENSELILTAINMKNVTAIPGKYKLPFRVDMTVKASSSDFMLQAGKGGIFFSGFINTCGGGIRRIDILTGKKETTKSDYENELPLNEYINLSVVYGSKFTWVEVNGNICYATGKAPYLSLPASDSLDLALRIGKNKVELTVKSFAVTEYENDEPAMPMEIENMRELSSFEWYLKSLPPELRDEVIKLDEFLLKDMKSSLKFKKSVDSYGNVTYISPYGFQFKMRKFSAAELVEQDEHDAGQLETSWIKNWAKGSQYSTDYTSRILETLAETEFADKMFSQIKGCTKVTCNRNAIVEYKCCPKQTCSSSIKFTWRRTEFDDIRKWVFAVGEFIKKEKI